MREYTFEILCGIKRLDKIIEEGNNHYTDYGNPILRYNTILTSTTLPVEKCSIAKYRELKNQPKIKKIEICDFIFLYGGTVWELAGYHLFSHGPLKENQRPVGPALLRHAGLFPLVRHLHADVYEEGETAPLPYMWHENRF